MSVVNDIEELIKQKYINNSSLVHIKMLELLLNEYKEQQALINISKQESFKLREFIHMIDVTTLGSNALPNINKLLDSYYDRK